MQTTIKQPLSNVQLELLKAFSHQLPENDLLEFRKLIADFFAQRLIQQADKVWEEQNWTDETVEDLLNTKMRKAK
jgi:uncharacterized membrane protein